MNIRTVQAPVTTLHMDAPKPGERATVVLVKELLEYGESDVDAWGVEGVRALVRRALADVAWGPDPLRASVSHDGTIWAFDLAAGAVQVGTWTQAPQVSYRLVDVIDREVSDPAARPARLAAVRDGLWDLVGPGLLGSYDEALVAYVEGRVSIR
jgi:hypothetical protein